MQDRPGVLWLVGRAVISTLELLYSWVYCNHY
jgi:hypothetical protein